MSIKELEKSKGFQCPCGKIHSFSSKVVIGLAKLCEITSPCDGYSAKSIYVICDRNTYLFQRASNNYLKR